MPSLLLQKLVIAHILQSMKIKLVICVLLLILISAPELWADINITNFKNNETVNYPLILIKGISNRKVKVYSQNSSFVSKRLNKFRVLIELVPGNNEILIKSRSGAVLLNIKYEPIDPEKKIVACYFVAKDGDTEYQTIKSVQEFLWKEKIQTALKLMQSFIAEDMYNGGFGRKTFNFLADDNNNPEVKLIKMDLSADVLRSMKQRALYDAFKQRLKKQKKFDRKNYKYIVIPSFTRGRKAHIALGGSYLAAYSSIALQCWPDSMENIEEYIKNNRRLPRYMYQHDHRKTLSAQGGGTLGGMLHELGHCFKLKHVGSKLSIMQRGFEKFYAPFFLNGIREPSFEEQRSILAKSGWLY